MTALEKFLRSALGRPPEAPPADLDADALWGRISAGLPEEDEATAAPPRRWLIDLLVMGLLLGLALGAPPRPPVANPTTPVAGPLRTVPPTPTAGAPSSTRAERSNGPLAAPAAPRSERPLAASPNTAARTVTPARRPAPPSPAPPVREGTIATVPATGNRPLPPGAAAPGETVSPAAAGGAARSAATAVPPLAPRGFRLLDEPVRVSVRPSAAPARIGRPGRWSATLAAGSNWTQRIAPASADGLADQRNAANRPATGASVGLTVDYRLSPRWSVAGGLHYRRTIGAFEYEAEFDTAVAHPSPLNTGSVRAVLRYRVAHNHRLHYLSVPLTLRYERGFGKLSVGLGGGGAYNVVTRATGKTLVGPRDVRAYGPADGEVSTTFWSAHLQPQLRWQRSARTSFVFSPLLSYQRPVRGAVSGASAALWGLDVTIGIRRDL